MLSITSNELVVKYELPGFPFKFELSISNYMGLLTLVSSLTRVLLLCNAQVRPSITDFQVGTFWSSGGELDGKNV